MAVDIPMGRVKFNVNTEYAYIQNFKILQSMLILDAIQISPLTEHQLTVISKIVSPSMASTEPSLSNLS
jgi:hypothetical protein